MTAHHGTRVLREPKFIEFGRDMLCGLIIDANQLGQSHHTVDARERHKFVGTTGSYVDRPWSD